MIFCLTSFDVHCSFVARWMLLEIDHSFRKLRHPFHISCWSSHFQLFLMYMYSKGLRSIRPGVNLLHIFVDHPKGDCCRGGFDSNVELINPGRIGHNFLLFINAAEHNKFDLNINRDNRHHVYLKIWHKTTEQETRNSNFFFGSIYEFN